MKSKSKFYKIGILFIISAFALWLVAAVIPFTGFSVAQKAGLVTAALIAGEILFWIGLTLAGKEVLTKMKHYMNPKNWKKSEA